MPNYADTFAKSKIPKILKRVHKINLEECYCCDKEKYAIKF